MESKLVTLHDTRKVDTPLIPEWVEELLQVLGIWAPWQQVVGGLRSGFSVGITHSLLRSHVF